MWQILRGTCQGLQQRCSSSTINSTNLLLLLRSSTILLLHSSNLLLRSSTILFRSSNISFSNPRIKVADLPVELAKRHRSVRILFITIIIIISSSSSTSSIISRISNNTKREYQNLRLPALILPKVLANLAPIA
jgi:hypothetical protein